MLQGDTKSKQSWKAFTLGFRVISLFYHCTVVSQIKLSRTFASQLLMVVCLASLGCSSCKWAGQHCFQSLYVFFFQGKFEFDAGCLADTGRLYSCSGSAEINELCFRWAEGVLITLEI